MIIVTGANGFIGSAFIWELNQRGITDIVAVDSVGLDTRNVLAKRKYAKFFLAQELWSFLDQPEIQKKVSWVIHMGACSSTTEKNWDFLYSNNFEYSQRLFNWSSQYQKSLIMPAVPLPTEPEKMDLMTHLIQKN